MANVLTFVITDFLTEKVMIHFDAIKKDIFGHLELFGDGFPVVGVGAEVGGAADPGTLFGGEVAVPEGSARWAGRFVFRGGGHVQVLRWVGVNSCLLVFYCTYAS
jgi:hypothetical protein